MANMSYCRFQNTLLDFTDCYNTIDEAIMDDVDFDTFCEELGADERLAFTRLVHKAKLFLELVNEFQDVEA